MFFVNSEIWLEWLKDEMKYAEPTDRAKVNSLFERAVSDYVCMYYLLVLMHLQFCFDSVAFYDFSSLHVDLL